MSPRKNRGILIYLAIALAVMMSLILLLQMSTRSTSNYIYSDIVKLFNDYKVSRYTFDIGSGELVIYELNDPSAISELRTTGTPSAFQQKGLPIVYKVPNVNVFMYNVGFVNTNDDTNYNSSYNQLYPDAPVNGDLSQSSDNSWLLNIIPSFLILAIMIVMMVIFMRQAGGGGKINSFGKANIKAQSASARKTTFADVAGAEEEKEEMAEIVDFLKNPRKYSEIGARIPKGVLLLGPPGTGKTLMARAVAGEAGVPFFSISGSDFVEMFVGVGASRVRDLFETAKKNSPSIVFIDEIDAVGRHRGAGLGGGHDEREQTLNQLLVEMDGFAANDSVIVIAATNRRDILDPALLRPGRFDRQIVVGYPDVKGREQVLKVHTRNKPLGPDVDLSVIAKTTVGFTGADLENLVNEASLLAARNNRKAIIRDDIEEATIKVIAGPEKKSKVVTEKEKRLTAYHEAGHAVCTYYCETQDKVHQVSIIPRGMAGGYTMSLPEHDKSFVSKREMEENVVTLLGGRMAEKLILDDITTGASNDIERATNIARNMVTKYGFSEKLGPIVYGHDQGEVFLGRDFSSTPNYSDHIAAEIDAEIRNIIDNGYERCRELLEQHKDQLHLIAKHLMQFEKIESDDFEKLMKGEITEADFQAAIEAEHEKQEEQKKKEQTPSSEEKQENTPVVVAPDPQPPSKETDIGKILDVTVDDRTVIRPSSSPVEEEEEDPIANLVEPAELSEFADHKDEKDRTDGPDDSRPL